jgi:hypothetical protein
MSSELLRKNAKNPRIRKSMKSCHWSLIGKSLIGLISATTAPPVPAGNSYEHGH